MYNSTRNASLASLALAALMICSSPALAVDDDEAEARKKRKKTQTTETQAAETQSVEAQSGEVQTPAVMVTASRTLADVFELPMTVNVLTEEDLRHNPKMDLGDILSDIPGVSVDAPGGPGTGRVSIRGEHTGRTLLLVDGVRMTSQASSAALTTFLMTDASNVERIEVIKGPASVLYGSEAIGGVINIITKKGGAGKPIGFSSSILGDTSSLSINTKAAVFGDYNGINYRFSASNTESGAVKKANGDREHGTGYHMKQFAGQLGYNWDSGNFSIQADRFESSMKMVASNWERFQWPINDRDTLSGRLVFDDVSQYLTKLTFTGAAQNAERLWMSPGGNVASDQNNYSLAVQGDWQFGNHSVISGLEFDFDDVDSSNWRYSYLTGQMNGVKQSVSGEQTKISPFVQDEWSINEDWTATMGVRATFIEYKRSGGGLFADRGIAFDVDPVKSKRSSGVVGSLGVTYNGFEDWSLRASWNQGRRDPLLSHLIIGSVGMGSNIYLPNPNLKPETSNNFEIGARYRGGGWNIDWALFYNEAKNFFDTEMVQRISASSTIDQFVNQDKARTFGSELMVSYTFEDINLTPYNNLTWIHRKTTTDGITTSRDSFGTPRLRGKTGLKWHTDPAALSWTFFADGYVDWATTGYKRSTSGAESERPAWQDLSFNFGLEGGEEIKYNVTVGLRNLFNQDFTNSKGGNTSAGRHYMIGVGFEY